MNITKMCCVEASYVGRSNMGIIQNKKITILKKSSKNAPKKLQRLIQIKLSIY